MPTIETFSGPFRRARQVNETSNGFRTLIPTLTEPPTIDPVTATGQVALPCGAGLCRNSALILPYGLHASPDEKTMSVRVIGWRFAEIDAANSRLWIPVPLVEVACTLSGTQIGVSGGALVATEAFADTITITGSTANANVGVEVVSPINDTPGHVLVALKGCQKLELIFTTGGSVTSCNALVALL